MLVNAQHLIMIDSPVRSIKGRVELFEGSALSDTYNHTDDLKSFKIERVGEGRFFGYGFVQKANIKLLDPNREKEITTGHSFAPYLGVESSYLTTFPRFHVTEVNRSEKDNSLSITAYDKLKGAAESVYSELNLAESYPDGLTLADIATQIANFLGINSIAMVNVNHDLFNLHYNHNQINLEGGENLRAVLNAIAEVTQTIYYLNGEDVLVFKRLKNESQPAVATIDRAKYLELDSKTNRRLKQITKATTLGDNIHIAIAQTGTNEVIMDNPFYELRDDVPDLLATGEDLLGMCINQFDMKWRGSHLIEIGDKLSLVCKDGTSVNTFLLNDIFEYDGGIEQNSEWKYEEKDRGEDYSQPANIGEAIAQTYAKVDKVNKQIDIVVSEVEDTKEQVSQIQLNQDQLQLSVSEQIGELTERVDLTVTKNELNIEIQEIQEQIDGINPNEITTTTGYTFGADGLKVERTGSDMSTVITEDGMTVSRQGEEVLRADNLGVWAEDLHATTYLLIGENSRFENYANNTRTGCFWIGQGGVANE